MPLKEMHVEVASGISGFDALRHEWVKLTGERQSMVPFHVLFDWYSAYLKHLESDPGSVVCIVLRRAASCRGILCLSRRVQTRRGFRFSVLGGPLGSDLTLNDCLLADGEHLHDWWPSICKALRRARIPWQVMQLSGVPEDARILAASFDLASRRIYRVQGRTCFIDCDPGYDAVCAGYSTRLKKILKKGWKGLRKAGEVSFERAVAPQARNAAFEEFVRLESSGWKGGAGKRTSLADRAGLHGFYRELYAGAELVPEAEISLMSLDGRAIGAQLCMVSGGTRSLLKIAYDQELEGVSPGSVHMDATLQITCQSDRLSRLSFVTGLPWMIEWGASATSTGDLWLFRGRALGGLASIALKLTR